MATKCTGRTQYRCARFIPNPLMSDRLKIISPHDTGIAQAIEDNPTPWLSSLWEEEADNVLSSPLCVDATQQMHDQYFALVKALSPPG
jgi:hypothetical protein